MFNDSLVAPQLTTIKTTSFELLEARFAERQIDLENWFTEQWKKSPAPFYGSVDLRNAGCKLAPVDMNLFPAGFNNLNPEFLEIAADAARAALLKAVPHVKKILIIPENHTRNLFYWENVRAIMRILTTAQFEVRVGSMLPDYPEPSTIELSGGDQVIVQSLVRDDTHLRVGDFVPDAIILNNDLSAGMPDILNNLSQPVLPPPELGWNRRLKSEHFQHYTDVAREFAQVMDIDPWLIDPYFRHCGEVDFMRREGENCLTKNARELFADIRKKYAEYEITCDPFIVMKADAGTYGMAVMTVRDESELLSLNRKQRTGMAKTKSGQPVSRVILQEGVYTFETWGADQAVAEPVVYLCGERVIGGFYRVHQSRGRDENLNAPGMQFEPLPFVCPCHLTDTTNAPNAECQNRFYVYGVIARLSMLAAAREIQEQQQ
ncbi:MAG: glutamate--cysteine ligase [Gammaproteobacteria bacterium]|nr:glutamate--cysteine ligase [Gammaproteobacteria bacterium]